jgi:hypothetical protein
MDVLGGLKMHLDTGLLIIPSRKVMDSKSSEPEQSESQRAAIARPKGEALEHVSVKGWIGLGSMRLTTIRTEKHQIFFADRCQGQQPSISISSETLKSADHHHGSQQPNALKCKRGGDRCDNVRADEEFESEQDPPSNVGTVTAAGGNDHWVW